MRKITDMKLLTGIFICAGFSAVITGAIIFFAHLYTARQEMRTEALDTVKLSTIAGIEDKSDIELCAHRGFSAIAPENTVAAITAAGEAGFECAEFDVQETSDGIIVLMHDKKINRMTDGRGFVARLTFKELLEFDIDNGANVKKHETLKIPTLNQALTACGDYGITPVIELKSVSADGIMKISEEVSDFDFEKVIVSSFDRRKLEAFRKTNKDAELWLLSSKLDADDVDFCAENEGFVLSFNAAAVKDTAVIKELFNKGISLSCWTVNDSETLKAFYDCGVRRFTTDNILPLKANQSES
ncbi:MAG: hypothetical protein GX107_04150 [Clostridiales bacterium]|nr:hypothetical protein [Clostridiales bacterium]